MAARINAQIQQNYNHSQDLAAHGRNPMGWLSELVNKLLKKAIELIEAAE
jgi:hypothetical protein